jgi:prepilin-type N-terminal cleavage/methylation domain-containing protein
VNRLTARMREREGGFTLVELLVTVTLMGVVGAIVTSMMIQSMQTALYQEEKTRTLNQAKIAMERMTREIRGANSLVLATPRAVSLVKVDNGVRKTVTLEVFTDGADSEIRHTVVNRDLATGVETSTDSRVLGGLAVGRSDAVFTYTDGGGADLPLNTTTGTFEHGDVRTIGIRVLMRRELTGGSPTQLYQLVSIRNLED